MNQIQTRQTSCTRQDLKDRSIEVVEIEEVEEPELREWKDAAEGGISIAEMINKNND